MQLGNRAKLVLLHTAGCIFPFVSVSVSAHKNLFPLKKNPEILTRGGLRTATTLCVDSRRRSFASFWQHQLFPQSHGSDLYAAVGKEYKLFLNSVGCTGHRLWSGLPNLCTFSQIIGVFLLFLCLFYSQTLLCSVFCLSRL